ncbi:hypothetical protein HYN48_10430 [Flavobacterium magnum]|uniref:Lipoprotein n=1 Tax=Flavobacterium magnum TaxID=2162713 RepID=A0A2S0RG06_9FLAO|nr:DUF6146 family protein [Flavobacterium magnum]AWA30469.1 hypothetical protein HYN48_10430 [Flavobacterium magnum]
MKKIVVTTLLLSSIMAACIASKNGAPGQPGKDAAMAVNDTVRIANDELEYEIIIIDPGFNSWFNSYAKPRNFYSQPYLEARNRVWVSEWNIRASSPLTYGDLYGMRIDYNTNIDYGYEVNYMLFNYMTYFQIVNKVQLGGFAPRI